jgi:thioredoxin-dependent peroxiredoxin
MVELRKRKAPAEPVKTEEKRTKIPAKTSKKRSGESRTVTSPDESRLQSDSPKVGDVLTLDGFGGEVTTHEGEKTTLKSLVDGSKAGVVLFTYPKASTPGCKCTVNSMQAYF